jgi:hypothetical protein
MARLVDSAAGKLLFLPWLFVAASSIALHGQQGTNFSGNWVLEDGTTASADIPARLTVQQPITTTTMRGDPMPPAYLTLTVTRHFANSAQEDTYRIGTLGGVVGGLPRTVPATSTEWSVRWREGSLWMEQRNLSAGVITSARTEVWRLDERGRLIVTLRIRDGEKEDTRTFAYRRDGK